ncbi:MAG: hypothetical protein ACRCZP_09440, partial [Phycicoccus sp.]
MSDTAAAARWIGRLVWAAAVVVMALSALAGAHTFAWLGAHPATGFAVGVAVDAALCIALVGDQL